MPWYPKKTIQSAVENSLCFGVYKITDKQPLQIGFARIITDRATFAWLCDVYIEETFRRRGLSKWLLKCIMSHPELKNLRRFCLATKDAHGLYEKFGFQVIQTPANWMEIKDNELYKKIAVAGEASDAVSDAIAFGIDVNLLEGNLKYSHQERIERHESAFELANELKKVGNHLYKI